LKVGLPLYATISALFSFGVGVRFSIDHLCSKVRQVELLVNDNAMLPIHELLEAVDDKSISQSKFHEYRVYTQLRDDT
jgi:hypothetical protein